MEETFRFVHFKCLKKITESLLDVQIETENYLSKIPGFIEETKDTFHALRSLNHSLSFLVNPFAVDVVDDGCPVSSPITKDTAAEELKLLKLSRTKDWNHLNEMAFLPHRISENVPEEKYPPTKACAKKFISIFGTTYVCESLYSTFKFIKSKYQSQLTNEYLSELLQTGLVKYQSDLKILTAKMNTRKSTSQKYNFSP